MKQKILFLAILILVIAGGLFYFGKFPKINSQSTKKLVTSENQDTPKEEIVFTSGKIVGTVESSRGEYLTDAKGRTLYAFADDKKLESVCYDECSKKWPVFEFYNNNLKQQMDFLSMRMNIVKRKDGYYQYAYGDIPVYYYSGDKNPGDTNGISGENLGSKWSLVIIK